MEHRRYQDRLNKVFKKDNYKYDGSSDGFAPFLRGNEQQGASREERAREGDDSAPGHACTPFVGPLHGDRLNGGALNSTIPAPEHLLFLPVRTIFSM